MPAFTIDSDNNITGFAQLTTGAGQAQSFATDKEFAKLTAEWPAARLADAWNTFAGVVPFDDLKPVTKFKDRTTGVSRIWKAIQRLIPDAPQQAAPGAKKPTAKKAPDKHAKRPIAKRGASSAREGSKKDMVLDLIRRKQGATLGELMKTIGVISGASGATRKASSLHRRMLLGNPSPPTGARKPRRSFRKDKATVATKNAKRQTSKATARFIKPMLALSSGSLPEMRPVCSAWC